MSKNYRVYNIEHPPIEGGLDFYGVNSQKDAIKLAEKLNEITDLTWVWA